MARTTRILFNDYSGKERIKAPLHRLLWYFVTFGLCGERHHYKHVTIRKYFTVNDSRITINIRAIDNLSEKLMFVESAMKPPSTINCRCSVRVNLK